MYVVPQTVAPRGQEAFFENSCQSGTTQSYVAGARERWTYNRSMSHQVSVVIERDEDGFFAYCPQLEGCHSQGETLDEIMRNIQEAVSLYLETLSEEETRELLSRTVLTTSIEVKVA